MNQICDRLNQLRKPALSVDLYCRCIIDHCIFRYNGQTDKLHMSYSVMKRSKLSFVGRLILRIFRLFHLVHVRESKKDKEVFTECSNMTIINLALNILGPTHEASLTIYLLIVQVCLCFCLTRGNVNEKLYLYS